MPYTVIVHVTNEDAFLAEIDELPNANDNVLVVRNARKKDGKPLQQFDTETIIAAYPWTRVTFLEILAERASRDELYEFFRDE
jgi:hypothetical protein